MVQIHPQVEWGTIRSFNSTHFYQRVSPPPSGALQSQPYNGQLSRGKVRAITGSAPIVDGFRQPTPYQMWCSTCIPQGYSYYYNFQGSRYIRYGDYSPLSASLGPGSNFFYHGSTGALRDPDVSQNLVNRCITEALVKAQRGKINLAIVLAEARKSYLTVVNTFIKLIRAFRHWRAKAFKSAWQALGSDYSRKGQLLAGNWLEFQYGWKPLVSDIYSGLQLIKEGLSGPAPFYVKRSVEEENSPYPRPSGMVKWNYSGKTVAGVQVRLDYNVDNQTLSQFGQLGLLNPALVAWELVPYSFVIDWLIPIGNFLEALTATIGLDFKAGTISRRTRSDVTLEYCAHDGEGRLPQLRLQNIFLSRSVLTSSPIPRIYAKSPFSSSTRLITAIALARNLR